MATREELARRLGIPVSQVTPEGLTEHEFPGVAACLPEGNVRDRFISNVGGDLLESGLADTDAPEDSSGYPGAVRRARDLLTIPEVANALSRCPRPTPTAAPGGAQTRGAAPVVGMLIGGVVLAGLTWWLVGGRGATRRPNPDGRYKTVRIKDRAQLYDVGTARINGRLVMVPVQHLRPVASATFVEELDAYVDCPAPQKHSTERFVAIHHPTKLVAYVRASDVVNS